MKTKIALIENIDWLRTHKYDIMLISLVIWGGKYPLLILGPTFSQYYNAIVGPMMTYFPTYKFNAPLSGLFQYICLLIWLSDNKSCSSYGTQINVGPRI